ncbi:unnamed protein product [Cuscuta epithymum]|uniref:Uncharacterized protein n=1 Tax=Cuscuta epithymum TaxID=186058 RepID=A0AAV0DFN8_9ASTE|nr:unnamed protein product [Cuscuta epithymum]CAH9139274.1 unnamed protein product [Cuscuta epithymum]
MGTKIQCKTVLPSFYSVKDIDGSMSNGMCLLNNKDEQMMKFGQKHFDLFSLQLPTDGYFESYEKEMVRQTILKHESTFRHQLQELHRVYSKQRDLMNDLRMRELQKNPLEVETLHSTSRCLSHTPPDEVKRTWHVNTFPLADGQVSSSATHYTQSLFGYRKPVNRADLFSVQGSEEDTHGVNPMRHDASLRRNGFLADLNEPIVIEDDPFILASNEIQKVERNGGACLKQIQPVHCRGDRRERLSFDINAAPCDELPSDTKEKVQTKRTLFGVVISEGKREPFFSASSGNIINPLKQNSELNGVKAHMNSNICSASSSKETSSSLPWFIEKPHHNLQKNNSMGEKSSYHMNLDLLQNCSQQFFKKPEVKKIFGVPIFNPSADSVDNSSKVYAVESASTNHPEDMGSGLKNRIDLNLSLEEEEQQEEVGPILIETEESACLEEVTRHAAEAIVSISSSVDCLKWFADLICSQDNNECDEKSILKGEPNEDSSIPDGMDYFEFMTLNLRDMKEEGNCYEPSILESHYEDEDEIEVSRLKRPRRGQARRGRQRRDFQRDVVPGLVSLARHEVSEDILTLEELLKSTGSIWQSRMSLRKAAKNGKGRRQCRPLTKTAICQPPTISQPICSETILEKTSLTGWGKRTRRLPRQRFPNSNPTPPKQC